MLFSEVYSVYFNAVAAILRERLAVGQISDKRISEIAGEKAFTDSFLEVLPALKNEEWLLLNDKNETPIKKPPQMPLTMLQKRWLKSLLTDPRIALFEPDVSGLDEVSPLFTMDNFVYFDRYTDGDPYTDEGYIRTFRFALQALTERRKLRVVHKNRHGETFEHTNIPYKLEYSSKDDKFRLIMSGRSGRRIINVARITGIELLDSFDENDVAQPVIIETNLVFELTDERNALERVLLHFSDCRKETRRIDEKHYNVILWYDPQDETEMLIRILSFGQMIRVIEPCWFVEMLKERIIRQQKLFAN